MNTAHQSLSSQFKWGKVVRFGLKYFSPRLFVSGLTECNELGKNLAEFSPSATLLDLGCGGGDVTRSFATRIGAKSVLGIEYDPDAGREASRKGIHVIRADLSERWPIADETVGVCLSSQNIEHMHRTRFYCKEICRVLVPGGYAIILTENLASWPNIFALLFGWQPFSTTNMDCSGGLGCPLTWHLDQPRNPDQIATMRLLFEEGMTGVGHVRVLAFQGLRDVLIDAGLRVESLEGAGYFPFSGQVSRWLSRLDPRHAHFLVVKARKPSLRYPGRE